MSVGSATEGDGGIDLELLGRRAVERAIAAGADDAEAWLERSRGVELRVHRGEIESLSEAGTSGLGVRSVQAERLGYAYGVDLTEAGVTAVAAAAVEAGTVTDPDEHAGLPDDCGTTDLTGLSSPDLDSWTTRRKLDLALAIERAALETPGVTQVEETIYADAAEAVALVNSKGFSASFESSSAWAYASAFAGEGADLMTGLGLGLGRGPEALDPQAIGAEAAERALALRGARQPESRRCPVVLDPFVAASFVGFIGAMLSADAVQRGRSLFAGREGDEVAAPTFRLVDDGIHPEGLASAPFDGEGSSRRRTRLIEAGRLQTFLYDARTARKAGRSSTGSAARSSYRSPPSVGTSNLVVEPGKEGLADLIRAAGDGLYVAQVAGLHSGVNPVSGTFSVGAAGRLIEGGELATPVRELTIASDLVSMLKAVRAAGSEARWVPFGGSVLAPPLLLEEMAVSGG